MKRSDKERTIYWESLRKETYCVLHDGKTGEVIDVADIYNQALDDIKELMEKT